LAVPDRDGVLDAPSSYLLPAVAGSFRVCEPEAVYRPRHPEKLAFYQLLERHFDSYLYAYEERFEPSAGPLRSVVPKTVEAFLACGRPEGGFARLKCEACGGEHLLSYSCATRNFCPSCQAKRAALFAEKLVEEILAPVPHRHYVFSIVRAIRGVFQRERRLLGLLSQCAFEAIHRCFQQLFDSKDVRAGCVASLQTFGSFGCNWNPHVHLLASEGVFAPDGQFLPLPGLDTSSIEELFRRLLLTRLHRAERLSKAFLEKLLSWSPSGFSTYAAQQVAAQDPQRLERLARYITRPPVRLDTVVELDDGRVEVTTPPDPHSGHTRRVFDPLEWVHAVTSQIPDPGQHMVRYYAAYSCRAHRAPRPHRAGLGPKQTETRPPAVQAHPGPCAPNTRRASWARLLRRVLEVDPLLCPCGGRLRVVSFITQPDVIDRILAHLHSDRSTAFDPFEGRKARSPPNVHQS
jgi:hypothetical protein